MRVLSIIHYPIFGGPGNRNLRLIPLLAEHGVETTVLLPDEPGNAADRLQSAGVDVVKIPLHRARAVANPVVQARFARQFRSDVRAIERLINGKGIDIVQINGLVNPHGAFAARRAGAATVWQILDTYTPMAARRLLSPIVRRYADVVMCTGGAVAAEHPGCVGKSGPPVNFHPPVDLDQFAPDQETRARVRQELGFRPDAIVIGTLGNLNPMKGHDSFVRAAAEVAARVPGAAFLVLGASHETHGRYLEGVERLARELGLDLGRNFVIVDPKQRVHELLQALDVFWMTPRPRSEGIPTSMQEAMALRIPIVSFDVGSIRELVQDGVSGHVIHGQEPADIARVTIERLLDADVRQGMGAAGRAFVECHASVRACADHHLEAYELALRSRSSEPRRPS